MKYVLAFIMILAAGGLMAQTDIHTETIEYTIDGKPFEGYLAYDKSVTSHRPGVLIVHQWMGVTDNEKMRARMLAEIGYVAFALDIYGKGVRPANSQEAGAQAGKFRGDRALFRKHLNAGLAQLRTSPMVDTTRLAAIGYCFGGGGVLELARSGARVNGVVSFHGSLNTPNPADANNITAKVLVLHGAVDPYVSDDEVLAFKKEMEDAGVDYVLTMYGGAVHAFTQKEAGNDPAAGAAYDEAADRRSWQAMKDFFAEIF